MASDTAGSTRSGTMRTRRCRTTSLLSRSAGSRNTPAATECYRQIFDGIYPSLGCGSHHPRSWGKSIACSDRGNGLSRWDEG